MSFIGDIANETIVEDLPIIKIQIENDLDVPMETEIEDASSVEKAQSESSEAEEGELVDEDDGLGERNIENLISTRTSQIAPKGRSILKYDTKEYVDPQHDASVKNPNGAFVTGLDIFSPEEQAKLNKRAQRFGIEASETKVSGKLLRKLYKSMCVKPTDKDIRPEALHMRGTEQMTTQDLFTYFKDYGPASLEWITDNSCNVVWLDEVSAARALLGLSVHIAGQPASTAVGETRRQSQSDNSDNDMEAEEDIDNLSEESDAVPLEDLNMDLPPGRWRRGAPHPLSPLILLRFATINDRSLPRPGYTKFGSHQFGGYVGLISESRKRRMQNALPAPIMFDDVGDEVLPKPNVEKTDNANPWGVLAKTWSHFDKVRQPRPPSPVIERILPMPPRMSPPSSPPIFSSRPKLVPRTRLRRERERKVSDPGDESSDNEEWRMRSKMPRMRMHADDEEKKRERRMKGSHRNGSQSYSPSRHNDLRLRIGSQRHHSDKEDAEEKGQSTEPEDEVPDLRVAVAAERSASPEDSKAGIQLLLFKSGNPKSVLRGARGYSDIEDEDKSDETEKHRVSVRRHRSRSRERRKHQRKHRKESHHKSRRKDSDSDSRERSKTIKSTIRRKSPEERNRRSEEAQERSPSREIRERKSHRHERRRNEEHRKHELDRKLNGRDEKRHRESRSGRDLRSKIVKHKNYDLNNEFRSKSPIEIEIDNDFHIEAQSD